MAENIQLSPEGAVVAQAVARKTGLGSNVLAPAMRLRETTKEVPAVVVLPDLSGPAMELRRDDHGSCNLVCNAPVGLRLGMHVLRRDGIDICWSIVARREGVKLWTLDYASESHCESEMASIRLWLDGLLTNPSCVVFACSDATTLTLFNPVTGQEL